MAEDKAKAAQTSPVAQSTNPLAVPMKLDAFILNEAVCGGSSDQPSEDENANLAKIAPFTQPNYFFLRFERTMVQNDTTAFTDLHKTGPALFNSRIANMSVSGPEVNRSIRLNRQGVYLHWMVPRAYRVGSSLSQTTTDASSNQGDISAPAFLTAPTRWLVIRKVEKSDSPSPLPEIAAWVVESNLYTPLDDIGVDQDIQVEYAPYLLTEQNATDLDQNAIMTQAEVFIGSKQPAETWQETETDSSTNRVKLNLLNTSNQLFADYQPHNSNVFSVIDSLQYTDSNNMPQLVDSATLSYYVLGWHGLDSEDPFQAPLSEASLGAQLGALSLALDQDDPTTAATVSTWLQSTLGSSVMCHGAMYNVAWSSNAKPAVVPADQLYTSLTADVPVAVGTSPMDAMLAYVQSHAGPISGGSSSASDPDDVKAVEQDLLRIQRLLHATDDGVDGQNEADDMVYNWNFASSPGGLRYFLPAADTDESAGTASGEPTQPSSTAVTNMNNLNAMQQYLDSLQRQQLQLRSAIFSCWWRYMAALKQPDPIDTNDSLEAVLTPFKAIASQISLLNPRIVDLVGKMSAAAAPPKTGVWPPFLQARDPTMLVAGVESGWPWDYLDPLKARLDVQAQVPQSCIPTPDSSWTAFCNMVTPKLPAALQGLAGLLLDEFTALNPSNAQQPSSSNGYLLPLYHDEDQSDGSPPPDGGATAPLRDQWSGQAWFPLFLEWEAEYTHIPYSATDSLPACWTLDQRATYNSTPLKLRYGIKPGPEYELSKLDLQDKRTVSGRVLLLPQANLNLKNTVEQVLKNLPSGFLTDDEITELQANLGELAFLSCPLSSFTDHLITKVQGSHVKPTLRAPDPSKGQVTVQAFQAAIDVASDVGFGQEQIEDMGLETSLTPYGALVTVDSQLCAFKPVTHGQFRFTALNVMDKFGQAIPLIDPTPQSQGPPPLYPCISDYYTPQASSVDAKEANTVVQDGEGLCQYMQLPPSINQPARLNSVFVDYMGSDDSISAPAGWRALREWDDSSKFIWGWVVRNYADSAVQLFLNDGTFFREIRLGGPSGATASGDFLPFAAPPLDADSDADSTRSDAGSTQSDADSVQLQRLAEKLTDQAYLRSFMAMMDMALKTSAAPPTAYAEFLSSIVGRPLALVGAACSLELAAQPDSNQSDIPQGEVPQALESYSFGVQLGDPSRTYDGLVGYFRASSTPSVGDALDLSTVYTHFVDPSTASQTPNLTAIGASNYPTVSPFFIDPVGADILGSGLPSPEYAFSNQWNAQLAPAAIGAIIDPFVPFHAFTGILPPTATQLPAWTWQTALKNMTAFFHMGPLLATADVPDFVPGSKLSQSYSLADGSQMLPDSQIGVPTMQAGEWAWLQPYNVSSAPVPGRSPSGEVESDAGSSDNEAAYMALGVTAVDTKPRFEPSPYTALEGYMQLRQPVQQAQKTSQ